MKATHLVGSGVLLLTALAVRPARAETPEDSFNRGWEAMERHDYDTACLLFDQSYAQSRATGPLQGLAACYEAQGLLRQALVLWRNAETALPSDSPSLPDAHAAIERLSRRIALLTLQMPSGVPPGTRVQLDGEVMAVDGHAHEVDPVLNHVVVVDMDGQVPRRIDVRLGEGEHRTLSLGPSASPDPSTSPDPPSAERGVEGIGPIRATGIGLLSLGAGAFAAAAVTGGLMIAYEETINDGCSGPKHTHCNAAALDASDSARALAPWNVAAWVVAVAGTGAGLPMAIVGDRAPSKPPEKAQLAFVFDGLSARLLGRF